MTSLSSVPAAQPAIASTLDGTAAEAAELARALARRPGPTVLAVTGDVTGYGLAAVLAHDIVVFGPDASVTVDGRALLTAGLVASLIDRVGVARARVLALTGRRLDASEALASGLVAEVSHDPVERAHTLARQWAASSVSALMVRALDAAGRLERAEADDFARDLAALITEGDTSTISTTGRPGIASTFTSTV